VPAVRITARSYPHRRTENDESQACVEAMHGEITYRPAPGSGAEFIVELPAAS
jgi:hypothetical protein